MSTAFIDKKKLVLEVYTGADGRYQLVEDDDNTEKYRLNNEKQLTLLEYSEENKRLVIHPAEGKYFQSPMKRQYQINFVGTQSIQNVRLNGKTVDFKIEKQMLSIVVEEMPLSEILIIEFE